MEKIVAIACDHAGVELKSTLINDIEALGYQVSDLGTNNAESVDYPDYGLKVAQAIENNQAHYGIVICGSGIGISIAANRNPAARAALCHNVLTSTLARQHNDANILALGARIIDASTAKSCVHAFLTTAFEGGRHQKRVDKLSNK